MRRLGSRFFGPGLSVAIGSLVAACGSSTGPSSTAPKVTAVSPSQGSTFGGTQITITGSNFTSGLSVSIGNVAAPVVTLVNASTIRATTAAHPEGKADVVVQGASGSGTLKDGFTYVTPAVTNAPPVIASIRVQSNRPSTPSAYANIDEEVTVTAAVTDAETPASALRFEWSASAGSVTGQGATATFRAPRTAGNPAVRLTVVETYQAPSTGGLPETRENRSSADSIVHVHDEITEVGSMAKKFLDLFSNSSVPAETVTQDFKKDECYGTSDAADELSQVRANRANYLIVGSTVGNPQVTVRFGGSSPYNGKRGDAYAALDVSWTSRCLGANTSIGCPSVGFVGTVTGVDWVTSKYDTPTDRWWLCDSSFQGKSSTFPFGRPYLR